MVSFTVRTAALGAVASMLISSISAQSSTVPTATTAPKAITTLGCYSNIASLNKQGYYWGFQSSGWCQTQCANMNQNVMAITQGSTCYCGNELPALSYEVASSSCNSPCYGFGQDMCGGANTWTVYLTGLSENVETASNVTSSPTSSATDTPQTQTSQQPSVITKGGQTIVVTASAAASSGGGGSSKVAIAVGVVIGVVGLAGIAGGLIWFFRLRRMREIEEEHRRAIASKEGSKPASFDQRLEPSFTFSNRRPSIGSIADERDFSRRILQV